MSAYTSSLLPVTKDSFIGVPTAEVARNYSIVHANADGDITFLYPSGNKIQPALQGQAFDIPTDCTGITATISVTMS